MLDPSFYIQTVGCRIILDLIWHLGPWSEFLETTPNNLDLRWEGAVTFYPWEWEWTFHGLLPHCTSEPHFWCTCPNTIQACFKLYLHTKDERLSHTCGTELTWCPGKDLSSVWNPGRHFWWTFPAIKPWKHWPEPSLPKNGLSELPHWLLQGWDSDPKL